MDTLEYWANNWSWDSAILADDEGYKRPLKMLQACEDQGIPTFKTADDLPRTQIQVEGDFSLPDDWDFNTPQEADADLLGEVYE